eukprot:c9596_g1_i1.p1 GENE.c9596_g1_i1~~c9596_g1_i1.p1  ORF type:complete len:340 (-),score=109.29 c9596_g1_i1:97-1116(-)
MLIVFFYLYIIIVFYIHQNPNFLYAKKSPRDSIKLLLSIAEIITEKDEEENEKEENEITDDEEEISEENDNNSVDEEEEDNKNKFKGINNINKNNIELFDFKDKFLDIISEIVQNQQNISDIGILLYVNKVTSSQDVLTIKTFEYEQSQSLPLEHILKNTKSLPFHIILPQDDLTIMKSFGIISSLVSNNDNNNNYRISWSVIPQNPFYSSKSNWLIKLDKSIPTAITPQKFWILCFSFLIGIFPLIPISESICFIPKKVYFFGYTLPIISRMIKFLTLRGVLCVCYSHLDENCGKLVPLYDHESFCAAFSRNCSTVITNDIEKSNAFVSALKNTPKNS